MCVCVCVCVYSLGSFTHPQPPFSIGMSVYTLCGILRMQGAMREIQNVQQREWVQEAAGDRCVVLKSNTNQTLRLSCCTPVSYIHMYIYIPLEGYICAPAVFGVCLYGFTARTFLADGVNGAERCTAPPTRYALTITSSRN